MLSLVVKAWCLVLLGATLIGIGGVATTLGWSRLSTKSRMVYLLKAMYHEIEINEAYLRDPLFVSNDANILASRHLYPRFKISSADAILTSGLFSTSKEPGRGLLRRTADYESIVLDINARLNVSDNLVVLRAEPDVIQEHRKRVRGSDAMKGLISQQSRLKSLIETKYPSAVSVPFLGRIKVGDSEQ